MATTLVDELLTVYKFRQQGARNVERSIERIQAGLSNASALTGRFGAVLTAGLGGTVKILSTQEDAVRQIAARTAMDLADVQTMYGAHISRIAEETGISFDKIAEGFEKSISEGVRGEKAIELVGKAARFEAATLGDLAGAIQTATTLTNIWGIEATDALDLIARSATQGAGNAVDYARAWKDVAGVAEAVGLSQYDVAAALVAGSQRLRSVTHAGTSFRSMLQTFIAPTEQATKLLSDFADVNLDIETIQERLRGGDFVNVYRDLQRLVESNPQFAGRLFNIEGLQFFQSIGALDFDVAAGSIEDFQDQTERSFEVWEGSLSLSFRRMLQDFINFVREVGETIRPEIDKGLRALRDLVDVLRDLHPDVKELLGAALLLGPPLVAISGAFAVISAALGPVASIVGYLGAGGALVTGLGTAASSALAVLASTIAILAFWERIAGWVEGVFERIGLGGVAPVEERGGRNILDHALLRWFGLDSPAGAGAGAAGGGGATAGGGGPGTFNFTVGDISVQSQATDAAGIARDIRSALEAELQSTAEDFDSSIEG